MDRNTFHSKFSVLCPAGVVESKYGSSHCSPATKTKFETLGLILGCVSICLLFSCILLYYYVEEYALKDTTSVVTVNKSTFFNYSTSSCNNSNGSTDPAMATLCSVHGIGVSSGCTEGCTSYSGLVCTAVLAEWQSCALTEQKIYISSTLDQHGLETELNTVLQYLSLASEECQQVALPLICLYTFPLCDCTSLKTYKPTRDMCEEIRDSACQSEWAQVNFISPNLLPDCNQLPIASADVAAGPGNISSACSNSTIVESMNDTNVTCRDDFIEEDGYCWPHCHKWKQDSDRVSLAIRIVECVTAFIGILLVLVCLGYSIYDYKRMLAFPLIFVVFMLLDYLIEAMLVIVSVFEPSLYCSHVRLDISRFTPSTFCTISGILFQYLALQTGIFCMCHIGFFFYAIYFPFHAKKTKGRKRRKLLEIVLTITGVVVPGLIIGICFSFEDFQYQQTAYPAIFCSPSMFKYWLYCFVVPNVLVLVVGSCLLFLIMWKIHKYQGLFRRNKNFTRILPDPDKRLLLVFLSIIVFGVLASVLSVISGTEGVKFSFAVTTYFACEREGHVPGECDRSEFERYSFSYLSMLAFVSFALLPVVSLPVFIINCDCLCKSSRKSQPKVHTNNIMLSKANTSSINRAISIADDECSSITAVVQCSDLSHSQKTDFSTIFDEEEVLY